jgi:GTPase SAR1 family protein
VTTSPGELGAADLLQLHRLRERLVTEVRRAGRDDLLHLLEDMPAVDEPGPLRVVVVGETKRGKSTLLNSLVGRPLLSPIGVDVTTSCWLEVGYGERDEAEVILADPQSPSRPVRRPCDIREIERYVSLRSVVEPVIGVQVRIPAPVLRDLTVVDTPGIGGLEAGHSRTTLSVLRSADALLFVCDCKQPVLAPEVAFLVEATRRVPTVVVAVTKCDVNPDFELVVEDTRQRLARTPGLETVPVLGVAAPLADRAAGMQDPRHSHRLQELSGIDALLSALRTHSSAGSVVVRFDNAARVLAEVCRSLVAHSDEIVEILAGNAEREHDLQAEIADLRKVLDDAPRLTYLVRERLRDLHEKPADSFAEAIEQLRARYQHEAEQGAAATLPTLASRLVGDMTATAVDALEDIARGSTQVVGELAQQLGGTGRWPVTPKTTSARFAIGMRPPDTSVQRTGVDLAASAELFTTLLQLLAGPAVLVSVITGPGVIAASLALAAGMGWWKTRGGGEQERRAQLRDWVNAAAADAVASFRREVDERALDAERHVEAVLPALIAGRERELTRLADDLDGLRTSARGLRTELAERRATAEGLRDVEREVTELVSRARAARR